MRTARDPLKGRRNGNGELLGGSAKRKRRGRRAPVCARPVCDLCGYLKTETRRGWLRCAVHS